MMVLPELVAHRGYTLHYPENTLAAIEAAVRAGAHYVEVDVQLTADGVPVLMHDRNLERMCGVTGMVHEFTIGRLRNLRASEYGRFGYRYAQVPITTLAELVRLLQRQPQVTAFIEIKRAAVERFGVPAVLQKVVRAIEQVQRQCVLISYSQEFLLGAREKGYHSVGVILEKWTDRESEAARNIRPEFLFCDAVDLPRWGKLNVAPAKLAVYEITDPQQAITLARRGVEFIETFAIGEMLAAFELLRGTPE